MGVMLYKQGDTHTVRGVKCEMKVFPVKYLATAIKSGFTANLDDLKKKKAPKKKVVKQESLIES